MNGMDEFASLHSYAEFEQRVKTKRRFVHDGEVTRFLRTVVDTVKPHRLRKIPKRQGPLSGTARIRWDYGAVRYGRGRGRDREH